MSSEYDDSILDASEIMEAGDDDSTESVADAAANPHITDDSSNEKQTANSEAVVPKENGSLQLENAMVGRAYDTHLNLKELKIQDAYVHDNFLTKQLAKIGLKAVRDGDILNIKGTPSADTQGEHSFPLDYTYDNESVHRKKLVLLVNSDPKSLWKEIEPSANLPYPKPHKATQQIDGKDYKIIAASRRGRSHAHEGTFRDDDFAIVANANGWDILIVADGAGSAEFSRQGSHLACEVGIKFLEEKINELLEPKFAELMKNAATETGAKEIKNVLYQVLCGAAFAAYKRIEQEAKDKEKALKDFSTTFLTAIVRRFEGGTFVAAFGIGDGAIGVFHGNSVELMNIPDGGEFSGQTRFLTMRELIGDGGEMLRRVKFGVFKNFSSLMLMTDGISDPKFGTDNNLLSAEKWHEFGKDLVSELDFNQKNENAAEQLYEWMDFWSQGEHDDRTLAILY